MKLPHVPEQPPKEELPPMSKRTLLQKYEIPIGHLDFKYVRECHDAKEVERILRILRSGEEGHFPDLQQCTETRLRVLNPGSKLLREEEPVIHLAALPTEERKQLQGEMENWTKDINEKNKVLRSNKATEVVGIPKIRTSKTVSKETKTSTTTTTKKSERIRSCDYDQWDKYDVDTELTKLDLTEERNREKSEAIAKRNTKAIDKIVSEAEENLSKQMAKMTAVERELFANNLRIQGNEHYKAGDYADAIAEYTRSMTVQKTAVGLANRAMAYLKLKENAKAIRDCDECLQLDPNNIKALLRKAQALMNEDKRVEAFRTYGQVLKIESNNQIAAKAVESLRKTIGELPPENAFRMKIESDSSTNEAPKKLVPPTHAPKAQPTLKVPNTPKVSSSNTQRASEPPSSSKPIKISTKPPPKLEPDTGADNEFAKLIIPKKIVPNKLAKMAQTMGNMAKSAAAPPTKMNNNNNHNNQTTSAPPKKAPPTKRPIMTTTPRQTPINLKMPFGQSDAKKMTKYSNGVIIEEL